jgi:DNA polymerase elongation subunit (family B)
MKGRMPLEELVVSQRLSRELSEFSAPSPAARAVWQLQAAGKPVTAGQNIQFLYTRGEAGVRAWYTLEEDADSRMVDTQRYRVLLMRAVDTVLKPIEEHFGIVPYASSYGLFPLDQDRHSTEKKIRQFLETTLVSRNKIQASIAEAA